MLHALGGPAFSLPPAGPVDWGAFGGMPGSVPGAPSSTGLSGDRAANKAIMQAVFAGFGWGSGREWAAQDFVEMREAGYNNLAQNPTSSAFGMGQLLDGTWASTGIPKTSDPTLQSIAMARYEGDRYGGPIGAAAHERAFNWYGGGGPASGVVGVGDRGPELARIPGGGASAPPTQIEMTINFGGNTDSAFATAFHRLVRTGMINLKARVNGVVGDVKLN